MNSSSVPPHTEGGVTSLLGPGSMRRQAEGQVELRASLSLSARPRGRPAKYEETLGVAASIRGRLEISISRYFAL